MMTDPLPHLQTHQDSPSRRFIAVLVLLGFLLGGIIGGVAGAYSNKLFPSAPSASPSASTGTFTLNDLEENSATVDAVEKVSPAVVSVILRQDSAASSQSQSPFGSFFSPFFEPETPQGKRQVGAGTGFIVRADGLIITNRHVADETNVEYSVILNDGTEYSATAIGIDPFNDLALLKIEANDLPVVELGNSDSIKLGEAVIAIGNALEFRNSVTKGVISGINRTITAGDNRGSSETIEEAIQTDAAINPGNSGGPLINLAGQVIGVNTATSQEGQLQGFAIPVNIARQTLESYTEFGKIVRPYLGVRYTVITKEVKDQNNLSVDYGVLLTRGERASELAVIPGSPADKAGLVENDILLQFNEESITETKTLASFMRKAKVGETIELRVLHDGEERMLSIILEAYNEETAKRDQPITAA